MKLFLGSDSWNDEGLFITIITTTIICFLSTLLLYYYNVKKSSTHVYIARIFRPNHLIFPKSNAEFIKNNDDKFTFCKNNKVDKDNANINNTKKKFPLPFLDPVSRSSIFSIPQNFIFSLSFWNDLLKIGNEDLKEISPTNSLDSFNGNFSRNDFDNDRDNIPLLLDPKVEMMLFFTRLGIVLFFFIPLISTLWIIPISLSDSFLRNYALQNDPSSCAQEKTQESCYRSHFCVWIKDKNITTKATNITSTTDKTTTRNPENTTFFISTSPTTISLTPSTAPVSRTTTLFTSYPSSTNSVPLTNGTKKITSLTIYTTTSYTKLNTSTDTRSSTNVPTTFTPSSTKSTNISFENIYNPFPLTRKDFDSFNTNEEKDLYRSDSLAEIKANIFVNNNTSDGNYTCKPKLIDGLYDLSILNISPQNKKNNTLVGLISFFHFVLISFVLIKALKNVTQYARRVMKLQSLNSIGYRTVLLRGIPPELCTDRRVFEREYLCYDSLVTRSLSTSSSSDKSSLSKFSASPSANLNTLNIFNNSNISLNYDNSAVKGDICCENNIQTGELDPCKFSKSSLPSPLFSPPHQSLKMNCRRKLTLNIRRNAYHHECEGDYVLLPESALSNNGDLSSNSGVCGITKWALVQIYRKLSSLILTKRVEVSYLNLFKDCSDSNKKKEVDEDRNGVNENQNNAIGGINSVKLSSVEDFFVREKSPPGYQSALNKYGKLLEELEQAIVSENLYHKKLYLKHEQEVQRSIAFESNRGFLEGYDSCHKCSLLRKLFFWRRFQKFSSKNVNNNRENSEANSNNVNVTNISDNCKNTEPSTSISVDPKIDLTQISRSNLKATSFFPHPTSTSPPSLLLPPLKAHVWGSLSLLCKFRSPIQRVSLVKYYRNKLQEAGEKLNFIVAEHNKERYNLFVNSNQFYNNYYRQGQKQSNEEKDLQIDPVSNRENINENHDNDCRKWINPYVLRTNIKSTLSDPLNTNFSYNFNNHVNEKHQSLLHQQHIVSLNPNGSVFVVFKDSSSALEYIELFNQKFSGPTGQRGAWSRRQIQKKQRLRRKIRKNVIFSDKNNNISSCDKNVKDDKESIIDGDEDFFSFGEEDEDEIFKEENIGSDFSDMIYKASYAVRNQQQAIVAGPPQEVHREALSINPRVSNVFLIIFFFSMLFLMLIWGALIAFLSSVDNIINVPYGISDDTRKFFLNIGPTPKAFIQAWLPVSIAALFRIFLFKTIPKALAIGGSHNREHSFASEVFLNFIFFFVVSVILQAAFQSSFQQLARLIEVFSSPVLKMLFLSILSPSGGYWYANVIIGNIQSTLEPLMFGVLIVQAILLNSVSNQSQYDSLYKRNPPAFVRDYSGLIITIGMGALFHTTVPLLGWFVGLSLVITYCTMRGALIDIYVPLLDPSTQMVTNFGSLQLACRSLSVLYFTSVAGLAFRYSLHYNTKVEKTEVSDKGVIDNDQSFIPLFLTLLATVGSLILIFFTFFETSKWQISIQLLREVQKSDEKEKVIKKKTPDSCEDHNNAHQCSKSDVIVSISSQYPQNSLSNEDINVGYKINYPLIDKMGKNFILINTLSQIFNFGIILTQKEERWKKKLQRNYDFLKPCSFDKEKKKLCNNNEVVSNSNNKFEEMISFDPPSKILPITTTSFSFLDDDPLALLSNIDNINSKKGDVVTNDIIIECNRNKTHIVNESDEEFGIKNFNRYLRIEDFKSSSVFYCVFTKKTRPTSLCVDDPFSYASRHTFNNYFALVDYVTDFEALLIAHNFIEDLGLIKNNNENSFYNDNFCNSVDMIIDSNNEKKRKDVTNVNKMSQAKDLLVLSARKRKFIIRFWHGDLINAPNYGELSKMNQFLINSVFIFQQMSIAHLIFIPK